MVTISATWSTVHPVILKFHLRMRSEIVWVPHCTHEMQSVRAFLRHCRADLLHQQVPGEQAESHRNDSHHLGALVEVNSLELEVFELWALRNLNQIINIPLVRASTYDYLSDAIGGNAEEVYRIRPLSYDSVGRCERNQDPPFTLMTPVLTLPKEEIRTI